MTARDSRVALVVGASGGLGQALYQQLKTDDSVDEVLAVSRSAPEVPEPLWFQADTSAPDQLDALAQQIGEQFGKVNLLINCTGMLHEPGVRPEKSLRDLSQQSFLKLMAVNAYSPLAVLGAFAPLLRNAARESGPAPAKAIAVTLSAMVGSISDNRLGGWYSYRMSKAALNMGLRNAAIELARYPDGPVVVALHPGTTLTSLSEPFVGGQRPNGKARSASESAVHILKVIGALTEEDTGKFLNWDGNELEW